MLGLGFPSSHMHLSWLKGKEAAGLPKSIRNAGLTVARSWRPGASKRRLF